MTSPSTPCMVVLTVETAQEILDLGGTQHWRIGRWRLDHNAYVVCVRNGHHVHSPQGDAIAHGEAFLVGKVDGLVPSGEPDRQKLLISEWAAVSAKGCWDGDRYPIRYRTLEEFGIDPDALVFQKMADPIAVVDDGASEEVAETTVAPEPRSPSFDVTTVLAKAKEAISASLGLPVSAIEITIRA